MERPELIKKIKELFFNHRQATDMDDEYTDEIYDFLVAEGRINLTNEQKLDIFVQGKRVYATELTMQVDSLDIAESKQALTTLRDMKMNRLPPDKKAYVGAICKRILIKQYFDRTETLSL